MFLADSQTTEKLGQALAKAMGHFDHGLVVSLSGQLGAGKTALVRACIQAHGYSGPVVSPTYTLMERYALPSQVIYHLDLYRLADPEELEYIGLREVDDANTWIFVEWAERGQGFLPSIDAHFHLSYAQTGRQIKGLGHSRSGQALCQLLGLTGEASTEDG